MSSISERLRERDPLRIGSIADLHTEAADTIDELVEALEHTTEWIEADDPFARELVAKSRALIAKVKGEAK